MRDGANDCRNDSRLLERRFRMLKMMTMMMTMMRMKMIVMRKRMMMMMMMMMMKRRRSRLGHLDANRFIFAIHHEPFFRVYIEWICSRIRKISPVDCIYLQCTTL